MLTLPELRDRLDALHVTLRRDGERIQTHGAALPADVQAAIRQHKPVLLAMLKANAGESWWYHHAVQRVMPFVFEVAQPIADSPECAVCGLLFWREYDDRRQQPAVYRYICNTCWPLPAASPPDTTEGEGNG